jgi:hypothetical protein
LDNGHCTRAGGVNFRSSGGNSPSFWKGHRCSGGKPTEQY